MDGVFGVPGLLSGVNDPIAGHLAFARQETHQPRLGLGALGPDTPALFLLLYNDVLHVLSDQPVDDELDALMSF